MVHIIIHILPQEIDQLEVLLVTLKRSSWDVVHHEDFHVEVQLNMNLTDWDKSSFPKMFFVDKLLDLQELTQSWASTEFNWNTGGTILGCNDARRRAIRKTRHSHIMYLDVDNIFSEKLLGSIMTILSYAEHTENKVFCPETTRMWDTSWDIITNEGFKHCSEPGHEHYDIRDPYVVLDIDQSDISLRYIPEFKFAGWGTVFPAKLAKLIDIPDSLGSYGLDDTFLMHGFALLKKHGYDINQYVIENEVIIENNLFRFNPYRDYLVNIDRKEEFLKNAHANFEPELIKLNNRLQK